MSVLYGWDGDQLAWESRERLPGSAQGAASGNARTTHYLYEPGSFVPLAQAIKATAMVLHGRPSYAGEYDPDEDPLWTQEFQPTAFDSIAYYQCDHLGTPQELTDEQGEIAWSAHYKAWGSAQEVISKAAQQAGIHNPLRFQGQYFDQETGLHYNRHRYYDPDSGRFLSKDPIGLAGGLNLYLYAPNPVGWVDPLGLSSANACPAIAIKFSPKRVSLPASTVIKKIGGLQDSHHIYQHAAMKEVTRYDCNAAPAISLQGRNPDGTTRGTPHYAANRVQDKAPGGGLMGSETVVAYKSLKAAGLSPAAAKCATLQARSYFRSIGAYAGTATITPLRRK